MGTTRDMIVSFVEGSCEDRNAVATNAGLIDRIWIMSRPPMSLAPRPPLISAFRLNSKINEACYDDPNDGCEEDRPVKRKEKAGQRNEENSRNRAGRNAFPKNKCNQ